MEHSGGHSIGENLGHRLTSDAPDLVGEVTPKRSPNTSGGGGGGYLYTCFGLDVEAAAFYTFEAAFFETFPFDAASSSYETTSFDAAS